LNNIFSGGKIENIPHLVSPRNYIFTIDFIYVTNTLKETRLMRIDPDNNGFIKKKKSSTLWGPKAQITLFIRQLKKRKTDILFCNLTIEKQQKIKFIIGSN